MKHLHWEVLAYQEKRENPNLPGDFMMFDSVMVNVIAQTEEEVIERAKHILKRNGYRLGKVWECHEPISLRKVAES